MSNYSSMLRDPRWQRKRLEIMKAADFACQECGAKTDELHIHHKYYERGLKAWEYPDIAYACLCLECHKSAEELRLLAQKTLAHFPLGIWETIRCDLCYSVKMIGEKKVQKGLHELLKAEGVFS